MKAIFISVTLLIIALIIIPIGGMSESNVNHNFYMYGFLICEILCFASLIRFYINNKRKQNENKN